MRFSSSSTLTRSWTIRPWGVTNRRGRRPVARAREAVATPVARIHGDEPSPFLHATGAGPRPGRPWAVRAESARRLRDRLARRRILGEGHTQPAGEAHAEIMALRDAQANGHAVTGATAYVTLEPCSHHGRTGPCCDALAGAGIGKVVASLPDPNPLAAARASRGCAPRASRSRSAPARPNRANSTSAFSAAWCARRPGCA